MEATLAFRSGLEDGIPDEKVAVGLSVPDFDLSDDEFTEDKFFGFIDRVFKVSISCSKITQASPITAVWTG